MSFVSISYKVHIYVMKSCLLYNLISVFCCTQREELLALPPLINDRAFGAPPPLLVESDKVKAVSIIQYFVTIHFEVGALG